MISILFGVVTMITIYTVRHYIFTLNRLFGFQRHPYIDTDTADWPNVTVLVAAHNEEKVVSHILVALIAVSYPEDRLVVIPVNEMAKEIHRCGNSVSQV